MKHTPGPWTVDHYTRDEGFEITASSRNGMIPIAEIDAGFTEELDAEQLANAKLMAAAPEMDTLLAEAADALNARPYNNDMVLGAKISDFRAKLQR